MADSRKQQKVDEKLLAKEKKKEEKRAMAEYFKVTCPIQDFLGFPPYAWFHNKLFYLTYAGME